MTINLSGIAAGAAGAPLAQIKGAAVERTRDAINADRRRVCHAQQAAAAAGVGEPDGDNHETAERDADGRRPWDEPPETPRDGEPSPDDAGTQCVEDPSQPSGHLLDLSG